MKSKIKRYSKSTLSVILSICMLLSCMTVGIIATDAAKVTDEEVGASQRYIYCGISKNFYDYKDSSNWGFNFWGGTSEGVKSGTYLTSYTWDGRTYYMYRVQVYDDNNKVQFKGNDSWWVPSGGFSVTLNGTTNNAVFFSNGSDGWDGQFQQNYQQTSTASLAASSTSITTAQTSTLTPSLSSNSTYNEIKSTTYSVTRNSGSGTGSVTNGIFSATGAGTYTVTATVTYNPKYFTGITKTATATKQITVTAATTPTINTFTIDGGSSKTLNIGETATLASTTSNTSNTVSYSSSDSTVISISGTTVKALKPGTATITASLTGATSKTVSVTVRTPQFTLSYSPTSIPATGSSTATPTVSINTSYANSGSTSSSLTYSITSGTSYASINSSTGVVTSKTTAGSVTVKVTGTISYNGVTYTGATGTANITVSALPSIIYDCYPEGQSTSIGGTAAYDASASATVGSGAVVFKKSISLTSGNKYYIRIWDGSNNYKPSSEITTDKPLSGSGVGGTNSSESTKITPWATGTYDFYYDNTSHKFYVQGPHTVTFNANGHGTAPDSQVVAYGGKATQPTNPTATGWSFSGWYKEAACTNAWNFSTDTVTSNTTLYAKWTDVDYTITYPTTTTGYTLGGTKPATAKYGNTVSFTVTPSTGYRIVSVQYTPAGGSATNATAGSNNEYHFSMPGSNVTITVNVIRTYTVTLSAGTGFATKKYKINNDTQYTYSSAITVDAGSTVTFDVTYSTGYEFNTVTNATASNSNKTFTTAAINANTTVTITAKKTNYSLTGAVSPSGHGTVKFYSNSACTTQITTATYQQTVYAKYTPSGDGYQLHDFIYSGTGITSTSTSGNVFTFKMGYSAATITANVILQYSITYYVDMHENTVPSGTSVAIVTNMGGSTIMTDASGAACTANLTRVSSYNNSSNVYSATINTPVSQSGSTYSDLYIRIRFNGTNYVKDLNSDQVSAVVASNEVWFEAKNETSTALTFTYGTRSNSVVQNGYRRIYLAKPYSWQDSESAWENIGIYHWGDYTDIGWNNGIKMHYLGKSGTTDNDYHYYYVDIPKALDSTGQTVVTDGTGNKVSNIIFQGWGSYQSTTESGFQISAQTGNIENIPDSANFFVLSKDGSIYSGVRNDDAVIPNYTRFVSTVTLNKTETTVANIAPNYTGKSIVYTSNNTGVVTVDSNGVIHPVARGTTTIKVTIYGTIGNLVRGNEDESHKDYLTYNVTVTVKDPTQFENFNLMSVESKTFTVTIPQVSGNQPGYFDMSNVVMTVTGLQGVDKSTTSAIITITDTTSVDGTNQPTAFTVKYAKANSTFTGYDGIQITGKLTTKSIRRTAGNRYGHDHWEIDGTTSDITTSRVIDGGVETATSNIVFDNAHSAYSDIFAAYQYVDVTFNFNYYEYKPNVTEDGMIDYPYDADYVGTEDRTNASFDTSKHNLVEYTVSNYEVRGQTAANITSASLVNPAGLAIEVMPENNYYNYQITAATIEITNRSTTNYTATVTVNMTHTPKTYSVYLNGSLKKSNLNYQEYAELSVSSASKWYAVDSISSTDVTNAPLLATGTGYKFRVKGDTYLRTVAGSIADGDFNRSEVDFSHYEVVHRENSQNDLVEYLLQNFYISDFFSPDKVLDDRSLPYDEVNFVGGGVVYYSMTNGSPTANALNSGYVVNKNGDYVLDEDAIKQMLQSSIGNSVNSSNYQGCGVTDFEALAAEIGTEDAMKVAYGTEIPANQYVENGAKTGILFRYLPLETFSNNSENWSSGVPVKDEKGNYYTTLNNNTFRYSNTLQSYQYVYASGNENKETNEGRDMRLYSYYIYSYLTYNAETNVPETKYEVVLSDNYSDASTYWAGN